MSETDWVETLGTAIDTLVAIGVANAAGVAIVDYYNMWVKNGGSAEEMPWLTKITSSIATGVGSTAEGILCLIRLFVWLGVVSVQTATSFATWLLRKVKTFCGAAPVVATCRAS